PDQDQQQRGHGERDDDSNDQRDSPGAVVGERQGDHFPTATFLSARAAWRILTPESLIRAIPASSVVWSRTFPTPSTAVAACPAMRLAWSTIVITMAAATSTTTTPSASPMYQPVEAPITVSKSHLRSVGP